VGWIPEEWECVPLKALCTGPGQYGASTPAIPYTQEFPRYIRITDITNNGVLLEENKVSINPESTRKYLLRFGDVLFARTGATVGKTYLHNMNSGRYAFAGYLIRFIPDNNSLLSQFLKNYTKTDRYYYWVKTTLHAGAQPNINAEEYGSLLLPVPPLPEQKKIAEILSSWDEAIEHTRKLIDAKKRCKKALMQQLLTGKKRLPGFKEEWKAYRLSNLLSQASRPVEFDDNAVYDLISVRRRSEGIFRRGEMPGHSIKTKQMYKARSGDFLISKMQIVHGASALVPQEFDGMYISGSYIALQGADLKNLDGNFLNWFSKTPYFYHLTDLASYGVHIEKMTFNLRLFLKSKITIPGAVDEQRRIAKVLSTAEDEIKVLEKKFAALEKQKRGLMQKLLTGELRVKT
jgi:type I restriction enzyme S subunit